SRRRHTRLQGDWSSDVCSSDLLVPEPITEVFSPSLLVSQAAVLDAAILGAETVAGQPTVVTRGEALLSALDLHPAREDDEAEGRSEERRVGKEGRCGGGGDDV